MSQVSRAPSSGAAADSAWDGPSLAGPSTGTRQNVVLALGLLLAGALMVTGLFALLQVGLPSDPGGNVGDLERLDNAKRNAMVVGFGACLLAVVIVAALGIWVLRWHSRQVFVPPPGWPAPPDGWRPASGWRPDPSWPPPPPDWKFWQRGS